MHLDPEGDPAGMDGSSGTEPSWAVVDGTLVPLEEARLPLGDRGFFFAESVYEVALGGRGALFAWDRHRTRLVRSLRGIGLDTGPALAGVERALQLLQPRMGQRPMLLYVQVTGGSGPRDHLPPAPGLAPRVYATLRPFPTAALVEARGQGIRAITVADNRWPLATFKTTQLLGSVLAKRAARAAGADDALFVDASGHLLEATSANLFVVREGRALTPHTGRNLLPGVTRAILLERARDLIAEADLRERDLRDAQEVFMASTTRPVVGVTRIDGRPVADGQPGPLTRELALRFDSWLEAEIGLRVV
jgi:D-alanine transaminase